ncbi:MAG: ATP synthase F0 subunit C [Lachnospiraceae bacterium]|nr:ATP synthase F0 subunit C [Lachnospiraceae bacterium]MBO6208971.1 ATP synthase F0 subunit C [Lachnospiraceae bacterium]MBP3296616.1 ATP synthase F0 subunit C [Lachnospiraceae bacterium]
MLAAVILLIGAVASVSALQANAADSAETAVAAEAQAGADSSTGMKALAASIAIGLAGIGGTIAMGMAIAKSNEGVARQPEAAGKIQTQLMLGLVFIETVVIYALIVAILIVFVL